MEYHVVTERRANVLDRLNLRDRSTYGLDWIVLYASSPRDAIRQWELYKARSHPRQADLETEAARYRAAQAGYAPPWEAERDAVAMEAAERLRAVEAERNALQETQAQLDAVRDDLRKLVRAGAESRRRTSRNGSSGRRAIATRSAESASSDGRGPTKTDAGVSRKKPDIPRSA